MNRVDRRCAGKSTRRVETGQYTEPPGKVTAEVTRLPRKPAKHIHKRPVPQTDTGGRVEHTEALERFTVKELGKLTP